MDAIIMISLAILSFVLLILAYKGAMGEDDSDNEITSYELPKKPIAKVRHDDVMSETPSFTCPTCQRTYQINVTRFSCACGETFRKKEMYLTDEDKVSPFLKTYTELLATLAKIDEEPASRATQIFAALLKELGVTDLEYRICLAEFESQFPMMYKKTTLLNLEAYNTDEAFHGFLLYSCLKIIFANGHPSERQLDIMDDIVDVFQISDDTCDTLIREAIENLEVTKLSSSSAVSEYDLLNVSPGCSARELKHAYRQLMKLYHPDKFEGVKLPPEIKFELSQKAVTIQNAYEFIKQAENLILP